MEAATKKKNNEQGPSPKIELPNKYISLLGEYIRKLSPLAEHEKFNHLHLLYNTISNYGSSISTDEIQRCKNTLRDLRREYPTMDIDKEDKDEKNENSELHLEFKTTTNAEYTGPTSSLEERYGIEETKIDDIKETAANEEGANLEKQYSKNCAGNNNFDNEENVELIKIPDEQETKEMILPHSENELEGEENMEEINKASETDGEVIIEHDSENVIENDINNEPELVALEDTQDELDKTSEIIDPLYCETTSESFICNNQQMDDDDIEIIEEQNSPICVDSEDDQQLQQESLHANLSSIVDTIDLLGSSDEEGIQNTKFENKRLAKGSIRLPAIDTKSIKRRLLPNMERKRNSSKYYQIDIPCCPIVEPINRSKPIALNINNVMSLYNPSLQTNFLNAVNLQPVQKMQNPPVFNTTLSNKNLIIPNAFYGNPPDVLLPEVSQKAFNNTHLDRLYLKWLENFLTQFSNPKQIASHTCMVLLQRVLKYKFFNFVKNKRLSLNSTADFALNSVDMQLMLELRNTFFVSGINQLSDIGRRFCELACSFMSDKTLPLTTDAHTGKVTCRTRTRAETLLECCSNTSTSTETLKWSNANLIYKKDVSSQNEVEIPTGRKRHCDDIEYTPSKMLQNMRGESEERKRSLRTNRTRRYDNSFTYNEDQDDLDFGIDNQEENSYAAIQRKIEQKRSEARRQRQEQAKSFENAFINIYAKSIKGAQIKHGESTKKLNDFQTLCGDAENSLEQVCEPKQHRIYKVVPSQLLVPSTLTLKNETRKSTLKRHPNRYTKSIENKTEIITCDDVENIDSDDCSNPIYSNDDVAIVSATSVRIDPAIAPKNIDRSINCLSEWCVLCSRRITRIVHHYVNDHNGCEVYTSRFEEEQMQRVLRNQGITAKVSLYKNGQQMYEAPCIFCRKLSRFMLPYWYQHFTMHTGEYAYRCSGCGIRKPTRSLLTAHVNQPCPKQGQLCQDYTHDSKATEIKARVCMLCNYVQLHRTNIVKHLRTQHGTQEILPKHIRNIVLLRTPPNYNAHQKVTNIQPSVSNDFYKNMERQYSCAGSQSSNQWHNESDANANQDDCLYFNSDTPSIIETNAWDDSDPTDDLSYMICGMLDVQMNTD